MAADSRDLGYFGQAIEAGSHLAALDLVSSGAAAFAAIDSASLAFIDRCRPQEVSRLRVLESLGPHPVQPVVARAALSPMLVSKLTEALLGAHRDALLGARMLHFGVERFIPVDPEHYSEEAIYGQYDPRRLLSSNGR